ncbi:hypothetical protein EDC14_100847 [Hydrogenispora ethanolica]|jgi:hypothetical protein|uniref:Uncharacterized protein n=1 Tax=Hydrogenispora ethanolica TaxID=1082276 RepID=A0A4R1RY47_HYDET|nr:hypothetical protein [Hydrogenispora ethanolica]TCL70902.1 hypothetical protein EDC14_100847 [Hydrogenispora ethanolica]
MDIDCTFKKRITEFVMISVFLIILFAGFFIDIILLKNSVTEISATEFSQEAILCIIAGLFLYLSFRYPQIKYGMIIIAGFFTCLLIRELDFLTDNTPFSWFYLVLAIILVCLFLAIKHKENALYGLNHFCKNEAYYIMMCGLMLMVVTSRIIGMKIIWQHLVGPSYRVVKNAVEEGNELLGCLFCLVATLKYAGTLLQNRKMSQSVYHNLSMAGEENSNGSPRVRDGF